ncbi:MAG: TAXI family TRAP transporter solute-binding subunit [Bacillota bacterium]
MLRIRINKLILALVAVMLLMLLAGCGAKPAGQSSEVKTEKPKTVNLTHITGPIGSGWYPMAVLFNDIWMDKIPGLNLSVLEGGAVANLREVNKGIDSQIGWGFAPDFVDAVNGTGPFEKDGKLENMRILGANYPVWWYLVVLEKSNYKTFDDIVNGAKTLRISPGPTAGGTGPTVLDRLLRPYGTSYDQLKAAGMKSSYVSYADAANMLKDNLLDAVILGGAPAVPALSEVDRTMPLRPIPIPQNILKAVLDKGYGYSIDKPLPVGTYKNQTAEVPVITQYGILVVHKSLEDDLVYQLTKHLWENMERIRKDQPVRGNMMGLETALMGVTDLKHVHPGAMKYYKEKGLVK